MSNPTQRRFNWSPMLELFQRFGAFIAVASIAVFGFWGGHFLLPGQDHAEQEAEPFELTTSEINSVTLADTKLAAAELKIVVAQREEFQANKSVPGMIVYDATKKVEIRATVDSVVKETLVTTAQQVKRGQPILVLTGPEIGAARSEVSQCESSLDLLEKEYQWVLDTHTNIKELLAFLGQSPSPDQVQSKFENKNLGEHRNEILSAYAELALATQTNSRSASLKSQGAISGKLADARKSGLNVASAKFNSIREELTFQISQELSRAKSKLETAKKRLEICQQKLQTLLGSQGSGEMGRSEGGVAEFVVNAPRSGQVVSLPAVDSSRFEPGEVMAEIADISDVWIEAQISQRDWHSLELETNLAITVRVPGFNDANFTSVVKHIGTSVSRTTMAIPLVAELENPDRKFRPGMSVWVDIPASAKRSSIVVPEGAVQRNELATFVFVQTGEATFEPRDVVVGETSENRIEIISGLQEGDKVVSEGSFFLKSEWLLAEEE